MSDTSNRVREQWWSDVLEDWISSDDHTVELTEADPYGVQVVVDGTAMFAGEGYPWETFTLGEIDDVWGSFSEEGKRKLRSLDTGSDRDA